ncbi:hypothetical protein NBRGN_038_00070 [Nocardia brasiliensis NBRC 14402]|uniref:Clp protease N-terminal domain-containing protein n=1 Tax=Nocardia brasiliensis TaxID=37326 RepID=UPI000318ADC2|nr:Clp protease N-terminal domain-containing protein [Nocardia brasiliensis]ASF08601.1 hypothetical protein CEQ30_15875 [Nocardia brasiliensis]GAJ81337.1 hypothetical protein NBRGN_038_00070 [Nocardia brasiliensis NBRC 14402]SUB40890.1 Probable ATP-dependent Clp protease ATP-binding subunit [Nocardia brasiliensis]
MFEKFSDHARRVVVFSQEAARDLHHGYIGAEHMLLAVLDLCEREPTLGAAAALAQLGIEPKAALARIALPPGPGDLNVSGYIPFTKQARKVLENSLREAQALDDAHIGPSHLLLALTSAAANDPETPIGTAIATLELSHENLRAALRAGTAARAAASVTPQFAPQAIKALAVAKVHAQQSGSSTVDLGHLLLGLLALDDDVVRPAFDALEVDRGRLADEVLGRLPRRE